jgi:hypothetical protein
VTDTAFIFALALGGVVLVGMLLISHFALSRLSKRPLAATTASGDEPDLFDVTDDRSAAHANREIRKRLRESVR